MGKIIIEFDKDNLQRQLIYKQGLSMRAIATYHALIDLSDTDDISVGRLTALLAPSGKYIIGSALRELEAHDLLRRQAVKEGGLYNGSEYHIFAPKEE